ncbi:MAG: HEAT repeat domain-containing protein [Chloroflexi bacterium]|nr:HEAT repeat domain-containing protein [Chloroflexota bacterium]
MYETHPQAINALSDTSLKELDREKAAKYLTKHPTAEGIDALIAALDTGDYGVRWTAAKSLASLGQQALPALLKALLSSQQTSRMREGAHHVLKDNRSYIVRDQTKNLLAALESAEPEIASMEAASELLRELDA